MVALFFKINIFDRSFFIDYLFQYCIFLVLISLLLPISVGADSGGKTEIRTLYISSDQNKHCLTPWMDVFENAANNLKINDHTINENNNWSKRINADSLNMGVSDSVFWLRFRIALSGYNSGEQREIRILDIGEAYPGRIEWSLFNKNGDLIAAGGSRYHRDLFAIFEISSTPQTFYLKVQSTTALLMHPNLFTWKAYLERNKRKMIWIGLFAGLLLAVGVYNLYLYFQLKDASYLWYVLHLFFSLLYFLGINGVTGTYFLPGNPEFVGMLGRFFLGMMTATISLMTRSFLMSKWQTPIIDRMFVTLFVLGCAISLASLFFQARLVVILLIIIGVFVPLLIVLTAMRAYLKGFKPARLFMIAWGIYIIGVVLFAMTNSGAISFTSAGFHAFQIGSVLAAILLSFSLGDRIKTLRKERASFKKSMERVIVILNSIESGVFLIEKGTLEIREVNQAAEKLVGRPRNEIIGHRCWEFIRSSGDVGCSASNLCSKGECREDCLVKYNGARIPVLKRIKLVEFDGHNLILESVVDISDLKQAEASLRRSEANFRALFESSRDAVMILDEYRFVDCNKATLDVFGFTNSRQMINLTPSEVSPRYQPSGVDSKTEALKHMQNALKKGSHLFEWLHKRVNGEVFAAEVMLSEVEFNGKTMLQALVRDISARKAMEEKLNRLASTDPLTGADNRRSFLKKGSYELDRSRRYKHKFALLMIDVDHFKVINDTYGHQAGDAVLKELVSRMVGDLRCTDMLGRIGGEEFAVILPETDRANAIEVGQRLCRTLAGTPVPSKNGAIRFTVSIGLSMFNERDTLDDLMGRADAALYNAKQAGRNRLMSE